MSRTPALPSGRALVELARLSNYYGKDPDYVLAGGGNTSVKIGDRLYIKGSGTELARVRPADFVALDRAKVRQTLANRYSAKPHRREEQVKNDLLAARSDTVRGGRPSVESSLHELFLGKYVAHLHPWLVNTITCAKDGKKVVERLFGDEAFWVAYTDPGYTLAKAVNKQLRTYRARHNGRDPRYLLIQNHGPFVAEDTPELVRRRLGTLFARLRRFHARAPKPPLGTPRRLPAKSRKAMVERLRRAIAEEGGEAGRPVSVVFDDSRLVMEFVGTDLGKRCVRGGPMTPDQIVYCRSFPLWVDCREGEAPEAVAQRLLRELSKFRAKWEYPPKVIAVQNLGIFTVGETPKAADVVRMVYVDAMKVMKGTFAAGGPRFLTPRRYRFIDEWEVEQYRRKIAAEAAANAARARAGAAA